MSSLKPLAVFTALAATLVGASPAPAVIPSGNLVANAGGDASAGATDSSQSVPIPAWEKLTFNGQAFVVGGNFTTVQYAAGAGFPDTTVGTAIGGGANFFAGGPGEAISRVQQILDVSAAAPEIDAGSVAATLSAHLGGFLSQSDSAAVAVDYLTGATTLGSLQIGPVTPADRNSQTTLLARTASGAVPVGTRTVRVRITATRTEGSYNDGYADNVSLSLARGGPPVLGKTVNASRVRGTVLIGVPAGGSARAAQKGVRFVPLTQARQIPVGSFLNTRKGTVRLTSAQNTTGKTQTGDFSAGLFQVLQSRRRAAKGLTELRLKGSSFAGCNTPPRGRRGTARGQAAASRRIRRLSSNARGRFRTRGRHSAATVRGTKWTVTDRCDGTLTKVTRGTVAVRDFRRRKTVVLRKGKSYLAKARR